MSASDFITGVMEQVRGRGCRIVLPEGDDERVRRAAARSAAEGLADVTLLGPEEEIRSWYRQQRMEVDSLKIVDPAQSPDAGRYAELYHEARRHKGVTEEQAREAVTKSNIYGMLMVRGGEADGLVSGAVHSTADTVRPALQLVRGKRKGSMVSSLFFMVCEGVPYIFSDAGLVENPDAEQLAKIAIESSRSARQFRIPARVALLSYSTKGSADSVLTRKVVEATRRAQEMLAESGEEHEVALDGELQVDAAIVPGVAERKAPGSPLGGEARVLIFPDLNAGNIGYKLVQRLGGAEAYGPVLQGLARPVNDLSRGCSVDDIIGVVAITARQAIDGRNESS
ncbi:phosphate acetyltransferase [Kiritimatiella glycovorans]|uniref:Phosphate acetyltransferase n=1 Tax=Kiritimatiella glycovorans TaxID=1307763 RepID=A0A0G3EGZ3_9BACT|nr:phosphate acetyltransferase [Kiritimatiella glycovorans]AKJ64692.1 Phosphate acetyltransferase [Kiritimatiella glycovorans]